jgi:glycosyl transferase family 25
MEPDSTLPIFVVSLADADARRARIVDAMSRLDLAVRFIDAVDGRSGLDPSLEPLIDRRAPQHRLGRAMTDGEFACALSHRSAWTTVVSENHDHALILEDDAIPGEGLRRFLDGGGYRSAPLALLYHSNARVLSGETEIAPGFMARPLAVSCFGSVAYTVSQRAAQWLLAQSDPVQSPADWPGDISHLGAVAVMPQPVGHPPEDEAGQSTLAATGRHRARAPFTRVFSPAYVRRTWRKMRSERIS